MADPPYAAEKGAEMHLGSKLAIILLILGLMATGAVWADEVVHFNNGTYLPILSHTIEKGMVHVVLGTDASMAFPLNLVERIEAGGRDLPLTPTRASAQTNRIVEGTATVEGSGSNRSFPVTGAPGKPSGRNIADAQRDGVARPGAVVYTTTGSGGHQTRIAQPFANHPNPNMRKITLTGDRSLLMPSDGAAADKGQTLTLSPGGTGRRFQYTTIKAKPRPPNPNPNPGAKPPAKGDSSESGGNSS